MPPFYYSAAGAIVLNNYITSSRLQHLHLCTCMILLKYISRGPWSW